MFCRLHRALISLHCMFWGHDWLPFPQDIWQPIRCHRCGYQTFNYWKGRVTT